MKVELDLTQSQLNFLKDILHFKSIELDTKQNNLLMSRDFNIDQKEVKHYEDLLQQLEQPIFYVDLILHQLANKVFND